MSGLKDVGDIAADLVKGAPEVSEHSKLNMGENGLTSQPVDCYGQAFDEVIHETDNEGKPILSAKGQLKMKRNWKRAKRRHEKRSKEEQAEQVNQQQEGIVSQKAEFVEGSASPETPEGTGGGGLSTLAKAKNTAQMITGVLTISLASVDGEDWLPKEIPNSGGVKDIDPVTDALAEYMAENEMDDLPPSMALLMAASAYSFPRIMKERKGKGFIEWTAEKVKTIKRIFGGSPDQVEISHGA
jgi:hypothetical protein